MPIYHIHHIIPRHMGGTDDPSNLVKLTVEEHAEAHRKLWEEHGIIWDYWTWKGLSGQIGKDELLRGIYAEAGRIAFLGKTHTPETKEILRQKSTGVKQTKEIVTKKIEAVARQWQLTSPSGEVMIIKNLKAFCKQNGLTDNLMIMVNQGKQTHHKGWKCKKLS